MKSSLNPVNMPSTTYQSASRTEESGRTNGANYSLRNRLIGGCLIVTASLVLTFAVLYTCIWNPANYSFQNTNCGKPGPFYIGSNNSSDVSSIKKEQYPFYVLFYDYDTDLPFCSGAIVNDEWIVTSAHCFIKRNDLANISVSIEMTTKSDMKFSLKDIDRVIIHENYIYPRKQYDIALVRYRFGEINHRFIREICLPDPSNSQVEQYYIIGVGTLQDDDPNKSNYSNFVTTTKVNLLEHSKCASEFDSNIYHSNQMNCLYHWNDKPKYQIGDTGGPLFYKKHDRYMLFGLNIGDASSKLGLYTNVEWFSDWIKFKIMTNRQ